MPIARHSEKGRKKGLFLNVNEVCPKGVLIQRLEKEDIKIYLKGCGKEIECILGSQRRGQCIRETER